MLPVFSFVIKFVKFEKEKRKTITTTTTSPLALHEIMSLKVFILMVSMASQVFLDS